MAAIQAMLNSQKTALDTTINAARDNVKADNVTQIGTQTTSITTAVNAARDNVKADNVTQIGTQTTALTNAVNAKTTIKTVQKLSIAAGAAATIAAVDTAKAIILVEAWLQRYGGGAQYTQGQGAYLASATQVQNQNVNDAVRVTVIEYN
jgi:hypothetical protein